MVAEAVPQRLRENLLELAELLSLTDYGKHPDTADRVSEAIWLLAETMSLYGIGHQTALTHDKIIRENEVLWERIREMQERFKALQPQPPTPQE